MLQYRADIDGLRGVAVLLVVLFHAGLPYITGGFVGVDIFFVISGYLITSIIISDLQKNKFSYLNFYERRARRILPAFYFVATITILFAIVMHTPKDLVKTATSLLFAMGFSANIFFWRTTNYFSDASDYEPFLHTWSLGVEEQFYFIFPVLLIALVHRPKSLKSLAIAGLIASFVISVYATYFYTWAGYYLLPSRAWQMLAGAMLAIYPNIQIRNRSSIHILSLAALALLFIPAFVYDKNTLFPGFAAVAPTLGACLAILIGREHAFLGKILKQKLLVGLGLISYSLYLWHWPVFAMLRYYQAEVHLSTQLSIVGLAISVLMAWLSWRFVEGPFRNRQKYSRKAIFTGLGIYSLVLIAVGTAVVVFKGIPDRMDQRVINFSKIDGGYILADECINKTKEQIASNDVCLLNKNGASSPEYILWGDSHAAAFKPGYRYFLEQKAATGAFVGAVGCPPLPELLKIGSATGKHCLNTNREVLKYVLRQPNIHTVILHARWALSIEGDRYLDEVGPNYVVQDLASDIKLTQNNQPHVKSAFTRLLKSLTDAGKEVIIIGSVPEVGRNVPRLSANNIQWQKDREIRVTTEMFYQRQEQSLNLLAELEGKFDAVKLFQPHETICPDNYCAVIDGDNLLYLDDDHLSDYGAVVIAKSLLAWRSEQSSLD